MNHLLVKVCGLKDEAASRAVAKSSPDYAGFIMAPSSPRYLGNSISDVTSIFKGISKRVAVFVNAEIDLVSSLVESQVIEGIQLHGAESAQYCKTLRARFPKLEIFKSVSVGQSLFIDELDEFENCINYVLFDTKSEAHGGSGRKFNWSALDSYRGNTPYFLSGGIGPEDTNEVLHFAATHQKCIGVDINSRFELSPGRKDAEAVAKFIDCLRMANSKEDV